MKLLTIKEAAVIAKIKPQTLYLLIHTQNIPIYRLGRKMIRIDENEFMDWLRKQKGS